MARKNWRYALEVEGSNQFLIQSITPPSAEVALILHGAPGNLPDVKTAGKIKFGELVVERIKPEIGADSWAWDWLALTIAGLQPAYQKIGFLVDLAPDSVTSVERWYIGAMWPMKIENSAYQSQGDGENIIETVTFAVQYFYPTNSPGFTALFAGSGARAAGLPGTLGSSRGI